MADRTIRTIGATTILVGVVIAGLIQVSSAREEPTPEIVVAEDSTTSTSSPVISEPEEETVEPSPFVYRIGVLAGISTDNFWTFYGEEPSVWNSYILGPTKPALMSADPETGGVIEELAAAVDTPRWDQSGWRVRVSLRDDFAWSDGTPVTAHDIVFTFDTVRSLELGGAWANAYPSEVESLHADGDYELRIEFKNRPTLSIWPHSVGTAPIMASHAWASKVAGADADQLYAESGEGDVGGGRLTLITTEAEQIVSVRNEGYPGKTLVDRVVYRIYPSENELIEALEEGEVDTALTPDGLSSEVAERAGASSSLTVVSNGGHGVRYLAFNLDRAPMSAGEFRTAVALIVDRETLAESSVVGGESTRTFVPSANRSWFDAEQAETVEGFHVGSPKERLDNAIDQLASIGYTWDLKPTVDSDGNLVTGEGLLIDGLAPAPLTILTPGDSVDPARPTYVAGIAEAVSSLGFDVRPVETDLDTVVDLVFTPTEDDLLQYDMYVLGWTLGSPAFPSYYRPLFATDGELNNTGYSSKQFDRLLSKYENAATVEEARSALWEMEKRLAQDLPYLVLYHNQISEAYRNDKVSFDLTDSLGGLQARLGGLADVKPVD